MWQTRRVRRAVWMIALLVASSGCQLGAWDSGTIADIAALSFTEGGRTHMVFGMLLGPAADTGTHIYRLEGCMP